MLQSMGSQRVRQDRVTELKGLLKQYSLLHLMILKHGMCKDVGVF